MELRRYYSCPCVLNQGNPPIWHWGHSQIPDFRGSWEESCSHLWWVKQMWLGNLRSVTWGIWEKEGAKDKAPWGFKGSFFSEHLTAGRTKVISLSVCSSPIRSANTSTSYCIGTVWEGSNPLLYRCSLHSTYDIFITNISMASYSL